MIWLSRWRHCRGFGIQSPWAYNLVRYVINEHAPYYAYEEFDKILLLDKTIQRIGRLYFRLANYLQPANVLLKRPVADIYAAFIQRGCRKSEVIIVENGSLENDYVEMALMSITDRGYESFFEWMVNHANAHTVLVVEDIHHDRESILRWRRMVTDTRTGVIFDLYYCGLIFFDKSLYKKEYIINF